MKGRRAGSGCIVTDERLLQTMSERGRSGMGITKMKLSGKRKYFARSFFLVVFRAVVLHSVCSKRCTHTSVCTFVYMNLRINKFLLQSHVGFGKGLRKDSAISGVAESFLGN